MIPLLPFGDRAIALRCLLISGQSSSVASSLPNRQMVMWLRSVGNGSSCGRSVLPDISSTIWPEVVSLVPRGRKASITYDAQRFSFYHCVLRLEKGFHLYLRNSLSKGVVKLAKGFRTTSQFVENVLLERILGYSQRSKPGSSIDDSRKHRSHVGRFAASMWRAEKHDPAQAWAQPWCKVRCVDNGLESSDEFQKSISHELYLLSNNASETVTDEHDRPLVVLSHCKQGSPLLTVDKVLDLLQCGS